MSTKISIIVPVYKAEKYLHRCVDSILAQTFTDFELLLIDDGSPDRSGEICEEYTLSDKRVRTFHNDNMGAGAAREFGVANALGEWIMFVDSDDSIPHSCLFELIQKDDTNVDIISGKCYNQEDSTYYTHKRCGILTNIEYTCALLSGETLDGPCAKIIRRKLFDDYNLSTPKRIRQN